MEGTLQIGKVIFASCSTVISLPPLTETEHEFCTFSFLSDTCQADGHGFVGHDTGDLQMSSTFFSGNQFLCVVR